MRLAVLLPVVAGLGLTFFLSCSPSAEGEGEGEGDSGEGEGEGDPGEGEGEGDPGEGEGEGDPGEGEGEGDPGEGEGEGDPGEGEGEGEGEPPACAADLPPPADPCIPFCGNEKGVGQPCTLRGGECNAFIGSGAGFCTVDFQADAIAFCTKPCRTDDQCGTDAVCEADPADPQGSKGCVPATCSAAG